MKKEKSPIPLRRYDDQALTTIENKMNNSFTRARGGYSLSNTNQNSAQKQLFNKESKTKKFKG